MAKFFNLGELIDRDRGVDALDALAVIDLSSNSPREVSYRELDRLANGVAHLLRERNFARGERVAILSANRVEFLAALYGIMRAGLVAVPVNFKFPPQMIDYVLRDSDARLVFCDAPRRRDVPHDLPVIEFGAEFESGLINKPFETVHPEQGETGLFLYTSGSTGKPKGVMLSHQSHIWVAETRLGDNDWSWQRLLIAAPLYHMNALALSLLASVAHAAIVLMPQFNARTYIEAINRYKATWLTAVPPMMAMMLREQDALQSADLSSVRSLRMGSAPVSQSLIDQLRRCFPEAVISNAYGTTEAGPVVFGPHPLGLKQPELSVGYPHPAVQLRLLDEAGHVASEGVLEMKSPAMMKGYHKLPEVTRRVLSDGGFYFTGDRFRRDENGFHYFIGRTDDMFVSGGENIYPSEVEKMLERHPAVEQACVVAVPDDIKGTKPVAFVIKKPGAVVSEDEIKQYALANAPAYQHPRRVWFEAALPLSGTNKIDRKQLVERASQALRATSKDSPPLPQIR